MLLLTAMQSGRADRLWAASLLSAACGLAAFGVLAAVRRVATRWYGTTVATVPERSNATHGPLRTFLVEVVAIAVLVSALVAAWWTWIEARNISPLVVPRPSRVWREIVGDPGTYIRAAGSTLTTAAVAFAIGATVGAFAAVVAARVRLVSGVVVPVVVVLAATPLIAMFPLFARIFGYNTSTVRLLAATMVFFPVFVYTRSGLVAASPSALDVMHGLGSNNGATFLHVRLPAAVPHLASGLRIAAGSAVIAAVVGETLIGRSGLGVVFAYSYRLLQLPRAFAAAIVIVVISVAVFAGAGRLERAVHARWS